MQRSAVSPVRFPHDQRDKQNILTDAWVATHGTHRREAVGEEDYARTHAGGGGSGFASRVATADDEDVAGIASGGSSRPHERVYRSDL